MNIHFEMEPKWNKEEANHLMNLKNIFFLILSQLKVRINMELNYKTKRNGLSYVAEPLSDSDNNIYCNQTNSIFFFFSKQHLRIFRILLTILINNKLHVKHDNVENVKRQ